MKTIIFDELKSTQEKAKKLKKVYEDTLIVAKRQTGGKGTKGRKFISDEGGIYFTLIKFNLERRENHFQVLSNTAVSVCNTLLSFGVKASIKWPNDIFVNGKKICGILIENVIKDGVIEKSYIGIGLNVNNNIAEEIKDIAISLKDATENTFDINTVLATLVYNLYNRYGYDEYRRLSNVIGRTVEITEGEKVYREKVKDILEDGRLSLENGNILSSAEIKIL